MAADWGAHLAWSSSSWAITSLRSCLYARTRRSFYRELALRPSSSTPAESLPKLRICLPRGEGGLWFILVFPHQNVDSRVRLFPARACVTNELT
jgi:hypothetical protein